jgi:hypothetical protein
MGRQPLNSQLWRERFSRGYRTDLERSRNIEGTVPTREAHLWVFKQADGLKRGIGTIHAACGEPDLHWDHSHRLSQDPGDPMCNVCLVWLADRKRAARWGARRLDGGA